MNSFSSTFDNVKVDVVTLAYDTTHRIPYLVETPIVRNVSGHLQDLLNAPQTDIIGIKEREQFGRYRLVLRVSSIVGPQLVSGVFVRVTHVRHPDTKAWIAETADKQYKVTYVSDINANSRWKTLTLVEKDQNG